MAEHPLCKRAVAGSSPAAGSDCRKVRGMDRRSFLAAALLATTAEGKKPAPLDALLVGDSLAYQLGPRLWRAAKARGKATKAIGRGGTSTRQWREEGWFRGAVRGHPASVVLVCLGTNCTPGERPRLAEDVMALAKHLPEGERILWLLPPPLRYSTEYIVKAVGEAGLESFAPGPLPMEWDPRLKKPDVHPTDAGHRKWARMVSDLLWPED